jgi:hypothetical protein
MKFLATAALAAFLMTSAMPVFAAPAAPASPATKPAVTKPAAKPAAKPVTKPAAKPAEAKGKITKWSDKQFTLTEGGHNWTFLYNKKDVQGKPAVGANADVWYTSYRNQKTATKVVVSAAPAPKTAAPKTAPKNAMAPKK